VGVNQKDELKAIGHRDSFSLEHHTVCGNISDS
jgi:hypothetical protein